MLVMAEIDLSARHRGDRKRVTELIEPSDNAAHLIRSASGERCSA
jgi:hypothetical protein